MAYPLTVNSYSELRKAGMEGPAVSFICALFGSWLKGCAAAGVEAGRSTVSWNTDHHSDEEVLEFVRLHFELTEGAASEQTYDAWALEAGAPPLAVIFDRFATWSRVVSLILESQARPITETLL